MRVLHWSLSFHISMHESNTSIEVVLGNQEENNMYAIYFINKNLSLIELKYAFTKK